jgi:hypothetical protein
MAKGVAVPEFIADASAAKEIQDSVDKDTKGKGEEEKEETKEAQVEVEIDTGVEDGQELRERLKKLLQTVEKPKDGQTYEDAVVKAEEFEKDEDCNYHVDFVYAMANCRAASYKLDPMDWLQVKLKAGRIVPAMATTTAAVAGLQTLELVKLAKGVKKTDHRNSFLNLAVPIMQAGEPGDAPVTKLTEKHSTTLWDRWEVDAKDLTLKDTLAKVEAKYEGLVVRDVLRGGAPIYFHAIMSAPGKEKDRERTLGTRLAELLGADAGAGDEDAEEAEKYADLTITCVRKGDASEQILEGIPPLRVHLA